MQQQTDRTNDAPRRRRTRLAIGLALGGLAVFLVAATFLVMPMDGSPQRLRVGVLPDQERSVLEARYAPLIERLSARLGIQSELVVPADYGDLLDRFAEGDIDLALFGGLTFLRAEAQIGAVPLVTRQEDLQFRSYFLVRHDDAAKSLSDLKGARFSFGSRLSTSGHLMPRFFMQKDGLRPEDWFAEISYSGAHDRTAYQVRDGNADVGVVNADIVDQMFTNGLLDSRQVRILDTTPPYADYVWGVPPGIPDRLRKQISDVFLSLSPGEQADAIILDSMSATVFLPALETDYARLRQVATELSLLD